MDSPKKGRCERSDILKQQWDKNGRQFFCCPGLMVCYSGEKIEWEMLKPKCFYQRKRTVGNYWDWDWAGTCSYMLH